MPAFTVVLMVPDMLADNFGQESCITEVRAESVQDAIDRAQDKAYRIYCHSVEPEDFFPLAVFEGAMKPLVQDGQAVTF